MPTAKVRALNRLGGNSGLSMRSAQPVGGEQDQSADQQQDHAQVRQVQLAESFQGDGDQHHGAAEEQEADAVETARHRAAQVRHQLHRHQAAEQADRQVDQEDPVPGGVLHQPAAQRRSRQRAEQAGNGDEAEHPHQVLARVDAQDHQPSHRHHQRAADALYDARPDQQFEARRQRAKQRAEAEQQYRAEEHPARAETVGDPPRGRYQQGHREQVGDHHRLHAQRVFVQRTGHARQRGVEDGAVEGLHEEGDGDQPGQLAGDTGVSWNGSLMDGLLGRTGPKHREVLAAMGRPATGSGRTAGIAAEVAAREVAFHCPGSSRSAGARRLLC